MSVDQLQLGFGRSHEEYQPFAQKGQRLDGAVRFTLVSSSKTAPQVRQSQEYQHLVDGLIQEKRGIGRANA